MGENIPAPKDGAPFDLETYMTSIGRNPPPIIQSGNIEALPVPRQLDSIYHGWVYEPQLMHHDREWKIAVNSEMGGNSYFGAVAMLIYGDAKSWFWVRIQHLQFFEQVLQSEPPHTHPRHELYLRFNSEMSGPNNLTLLERLGTADYWIDHQLLSQVTADLYGIYLVIYTHHSGREGTPSLPVFHEVYTSVRARGNYFSPHRFLRYTDNRHYQPIVPAGDFRPSEYRAPRLTTKVAVSEAGPNMAAEETGIRRPYPDFPVPARLVPTPITTLVLKDTDACLEKILWMKLTPSADGRASPFQFETPKWEDIREGGKSWIAINTHSDGESSSACHGPYDVEHPPSDLLAMPPSAPPSPNYFRKSLRELEKLIAARNIQVPHNVRNITDTETKKRRYATYLEGSDVEKGTGSRRLLDMIDYADGPRKVTGDKTTTRVTNQEERSGSVLRQITTTTIIRTVTSVPSTRERTCPEESEAPATLDRYQDIHLNTDEQLQQLLLGANLDVAGDRETDIETYREFMRRNPRSSSLYQSNSIAEVEVENGLGGSVEISGGFNTTINVKIYSGTGSAKRKLPSPSPETHEPQPEPSEEGAILDVEERKEPPSSPEPDSPLVNDYRTWSAAALKRDALNRVPPIKTPSKQKAEETRRVLPGQLKALDGKARVVREEVRAGKRARAEQRREDARRGERPAKRIKLVVKDTWKTEENEIGEDDGSVDDDLSGVGHGETDEQEFEQEMQYHAANGSSMKNPEEAECDSGEELMVETPRQSENILVATRKKVTALKQIPEYPYI